MIGPTRSRVSFFVNKFRKLGFVHYYGGLHVHSSLLNVVLPDRFSVPEPVISTGQVWSFLAPVKLSNFDQTAIGLFR